tara:strand:+ start:1618 stop:2487 length:870 start_codon:yes stop_codon:yes gene_type:complete
MDNLNVLVEAKREYLGQLSHLMCPVMIETFDKIFEEAYTMSKGRKVLIMFQKLLKEVPNWNEGMSKQHTDNIANRCAWFNDLLAAVFVSCVKILSSVRLGKDNKKISLKLPTNETFIQTCYNNIAKDIYKDPYIFTDSQNEHARDEKLFQRFSVVIEASVRELIPVQQILQTYMSNESEDIDVGGEAEDTEDPEFVDEYQEPEPTAEPEMGPPEGEGEAVPMAEGESEPMAEAGPPMGEPQQVETESSPFDNEFKTISTTDQPPPEAEEEDDVLFPDASETRAKKVGYN